MKAIILGDIHLGKNMSQGKVGIGSNLNSRIADQINLLDWVLDRALEHDAEHIIITGDVWEETRPAPYLITIFISWLKKCQINYINVHVIMGNHDILRSGSYYTSTLDTIIEADLDKINIYKSIDTIIIGSSAFTLMPFRDRKSFSTISNLEALNIIRTNLVYELASIPCVYKKILIGHLAIEGSIPIGDEIDDLANELFCPINMFEGYDYVWMGHIHCPQVMNKNNPFVAHIGSMDVSNFGETDQRKHIVIIDCDSLSQDYFIEYLPTRPLKKLTVVVPKNTEDTTAYVLEELKKANSDYSQSIVRVEISLSSPELKSVNKGQIESYLTKQGAFNITGISESKKATFIKKDTAAIIDSKMDVPSAIKAYSDKYVDADMRADYIELSMEIYNSYKAESKE